MRQAYKFVVLILLLAAFAPAQTTTMLDRILATVNGTPIWLSEWETALRWEALMNRHSPESFEESDRQAVYARLVDQKLIREQMRGEVLTSVSDADVSTRLREIREQIPNANSEDAWKQLVQQYGLTESEVAECVRSELEILRFLDGRFRPLSRVDYRSVTRYYRDEYLPELKRKGGQEIPLADVSGRIREILVQQRIDGMIDTWLQTLREGADIRIPEANPAEAKLEVTEKK